MSAVVENDAEQIGKEQVSTKRKQTQAKTSRTSEIHDAAFVHDAFREQAKLFPNDLALVDVNGEQATYQELDERSDQLSRHLSGVGVGPDDRVAILLDRSIGHIVSLLGTMKAGGAYVPLDASYPIDRLAFMLDDSGASVVISQAALAAALPLKRRPLVLIDSGDVSEVASEADSSADLRPDHLAYVIYTSGSTGTPKGVAMNHRALTRLIRWQVKESSGSRLRTLQFTPVGFDVSFQEIFSTICDGGTLFLIPETLRHDPAWLLRTVQDLSIERLFLPFVALQQLAETSRRLEIAPISLKQVITAGEKLKITPAISAFFRRLNDCRLTNHYGPTETHLATSFALGESVTGWPILPPIGKAISDTTLHIVDPDFKAVASGDTGELYIGGGGLARGYLGKPDLTADRFRPNPFNGPKGARLYKTGDLVRVLPDGNLDFVGRVDHQMKVRGFRIEPNEVESALAQHPHVQQAAVGLREIAPATERLVGYIVTDGSALAVSELTAHLRERLPDFMIPSVLVFLTALPLTPSGKVDRRSLRNLALPKQVPTQSRSTDTLSTDPLVATITALWERVLGSQGIAPDEDFFDIGGDSLLAARLVGELGEALGREVELSILLEDATISGMARALAATPKESGSASRLPRISEVITLRPGASQTPLFLVHPLGGELLVYSELVRALKTRHAIFGLRWRLDGAEQSAVMPLEEMAEIHMEQMRSVQSGGPFLLAGWSFGGVLAFELAQQLTRDGERVVFLGLLDANPILDPTTGNLINNSQTLDRLTELLTELERRSESVTMGNDLEQWLGDWFGGALFAGNLPKGVTVYHLRNYLKITQASIRAATKYHAKPYREAIHLFQPIDAPRSIQEVSAAAIRELAQGRLYLHWVPGDHHSILKHPQVAQVAGAMDTALQVALEHESEST